jgi:hypothetical protein
MSEFRLRPIVPAGAPCLVLGESLPERRVSMRAASPVPGPQRQIETVMLSYDRPCQTFL